MKKERIEDYIYVTNVIPSEVCDSLITDIEKNTWSPHTWYNPNTDVSTSEETKELDVLGANIEHHNILSPYIIEAARQYNSIYAYMDNLRTQQIVSKFCSIRFNRYSKDQIMRKHYDHIHSIFDGKEKGVPVLSFIGNLNEGYEGGELVFFDGEVKLDLKAGDICMFPSCFMYPHQVYEVTKGKRYSFVTWGY